MNQSKVNFDKSLLILFILIISIIPQKNIHNEPITHTRFHIEVYHLSKANNHYPTDQN